MLYQLNVLKLLIIIRNNYAFVICSVLPPGRLAKLAKGATLFEISYKQIVMGALINQLN